MQFTSNWMYSLNNELFVTNSIDGGQGLSKRSGPAGHAREWNKVEDQSQEGEFCRRLNDSLSTLENKIMMQETKYLQEDCPTWNIIRGFEGFNERQAYFGYEFIGRSQIITRRSHLSREDRLFSLSSHSSPAMNLPMDDDVRSILYLLLFDLVV